MGHRMGWNLTYLLVFLSLACSAPSNGGNDATSADATADVVESQDILGDDSTGPLQEVVDREDSGQLDIALTDSSGLDVPLADSLSDSVDVSPPEDADTAELDQTDVTELDVMDGAELDVMDATDMGDTLPIDDLAETDIDEEGDIVDIPDEVGCTAGEPCDDGDPCTEDDALGDECACVGTPLDCDDDVECTEDACLDGECLHSVQSGWCMIAEVCIEGGVEKDDAPCLTCQPDVDPEGWSSDDGAACDDGDPCSLEDSCNAGLCVPGAQALDCADDNECTTDTCEAFFGCINLPSLDPCDDANPCTQFDACLAGQCTGQPMTCNDYNDCTDDSCDPESGCLHVVRQVPSCQPTITLTQPLRGLTVEGLPEVTVAGSVEAKNGGVAEFTANGQNVDLDAGSFSTTLDLDLGLNTVTLEATDSLGAVRTTTRGLYYSTHWYSLLWESPDTGLVDEGTITVLGPELFDDDDTSDLDDVATLLYYHLTESFVINDIVPSPAYQAPGASLYLSNFVHDPYEVDIELQDGSILVALTIPNLAADGEIELTDPFPITLGITLFADKIVLTATASGVLTEDGFVEAELGYVDAEVVGLEVSPALLSGEQLAGLQDGMETMLVDALYEQFSYALPNLFTNIISAFDYDYVQEVSPFLGDADSVEVRFVSDVVAFDVAPEGFAIWADTSVLSQPQTAYTPLGSMGRAQCLGEDIPFETPYDSLGTISWHKDYLNQLPHAIYRANQLHMVVAQEEFDADLTDYSLQGATFTVDFLLPPILNNCDQEELLLQVADMRVDVAGTFMGAAIDTTVWANYVFPVSLGTYPLPSGEAALKLIFADEPLAMHLETEGLASDLPEEAEALLLEMVEAVVLDEFLEAFADGAFGGVYMPGLYVGEAFNGIEQEDKTLYFVPDSFVEELGYSIVYGEFL